MTFKNRTSIPLLAGACALLLACTSAIAATGETVAPGPYYATPSWDLTLASGQRFIVLSNMNSDAVLDRETGLVWERKPDTSPLDWAAARQYCLRKAVGGRMGWRLPAVNELSSLYNVGGSGYGGGMPGAPFVLHTSAFWTSTGYIDNTGTPGPYPAAYIVSFSIGGNDGAFPQNVLSGFDTWCVRGGRSGTSE